MKKFIIKTCFFVVPFLVLYGLNVCFYKKDEGDLVRLGFLYQNPSPFSQIMKQYTAPPKKYQLFSEIHLDQKIKTDVLTIGDSFSEQGEVGYQNHLAQRGVSVLHIDRFLSEESPIQSLVQFINSDFFDKVETKYVVLQSVERALMTRNTSLSFTESRSLDSLKTQISEYKAKKEKAPATSSKVEFFSDATIKVPLANLQFLFLKRPLHSDVYKFKSNNHQLFTNNPDNLLFFKDDLKTLKDKNNPENIKALNGNLNKISEILAKKNIKLIVLIAPDKYDLYYPYISNKSKSKEPLFFSNFDKMSKNYIYIPSYERLSQAIKQENDIYFYDDTHWSYKGARLIANEIYKTLID